MIRQLLAVTLILSFAEAAADGAPARRRSVRHPSPCTSVSGDIRNVGIALREGERVVTSPYRRTPNVDGDLIALRDGSLLALEGYALFRSYDDGCSWIAAGTLPYSATALHAAAGGRAFAVEFSGYADTSVIYRIDGEELVRLELPKSDIGGLGTDPFDPDRLRAAFETRDGLELYDSFDGGAHWTKAGDFHCAEGCTKNLNKSAFFDPANLDHIVVGTYGSSAIFSTYDGGGTWTAARGLATFGSEFGIRSVTFSPVDANVIWAAGIQIQDITLGRTAIWRSVDGGATFALQLEEGDGVYITARTRVTPSRTDPAIGYFGFGSSFSGTRLYRYDAGTRALSIHEYQLGFSGIDAIVQSPRDASTLHLLFGGPHCEYLC